MMKPLLFAIGMALLGALLLYVGESFMAITAWLFSVGALIVLGGGQRPEDPCHKVELGAESDAPSNKA